MHKLYARVISVSYVHAAGFTVMSDGENRGQKDRDLVLPTLQNPPELLSFTHELHQFESPEDTQPPHNPHGSQKVYARRAV